MCHCGRPLHYGNPGLEAYVNEMVAMLGERVEVSVDRRTWLVPRHYIALHGLQAEALPSLGFELLGSSAATADQEERVS